MASSDPRLQREEREACLDSAELPRGIYVISGHMANTQGREANVEAPPSYSDVFPSSTSQSTPLITGVKGKSTVALCPTPVRGPEGRCRCIALGCLTVLIIIALSLIAAILAIFLVSYVTPTTPASTTEGTTTASTAPTPPSGESATSFTQCDGRVRSGRILKTAFCWLENNDIVAIFHTKEFRRGYNITIQLFSIDDMHKCRLVQNVTNLRRDHYRAFISACSGRDVIFYEEGQKHIDVYDAATASKTGRIELGGKTPQNIAANNDVIVLQVQSSSLHVTSFHVYDRKSKHKRFVRSYLWIFPHAMRDISRHNVMVVTGSRYGHTETMKVVDFYKQPIESCKKNRDLVTAKFTPFNRIVALENNFELSIYSSEGEFIRKLECREKSIHDLAISTSVMGPTMLVLNTGKSSTFKVFWIVPTIMFM